MAILTYQDIQRYMGRTFTPAQQTAATTIIASLERQLSLTLNRPLNPVQVIDEVHWLESGQRQIFLRKAPVREVQSFYVGTPGYEVEQDITGYQIKPWGIDNVRIAGVNYRAIVTYIAGLSDLDSAALEQIVYSAAVREMNKVLIDAQGLSALEVEGTKYTFAQNGIPGFTDAEMVAAKRFKRRVIR